jgi:hypothetical protein
LGVENVNHQFGEGRDAVVGEFGGNPTNGFGDEDAIVDFQKSVVEFDGIAPAIAGWVDGRSSKCSGVNKFNYISIIMYLRRVHMCKSS